MIDQNVVIDLNDDDLALTLEEQVVHKAKYLEGLTASILL